MPYSHLYKRLEFYYARSKRFLSELDNKNHIDDSSLTQYLFVLGSSIVCFAFLILLVSSVLFFFDLPITKLNLILAVPLYLVTTYLLSSVFFGGSSRFWVFLSVINISIVVFLGSIYIEQRFYDISYDGQAYHQEAIIQLSEGWNPYFTQIDAAKANGLDIWLNHYPKGLWILETVTYKWTNNIEGVKAFNIIFMFSAFVLALSALLTISRLNKIAVIFISLLAVVNPISIYQSLSFYQDGILLSLLICFIAVAFKIFHGRKGIKIIPFIACVVLFMNIKLTTLPYMAIFLAGYLLLMWLDEKVFLTIQMLKVTLIAVFLAICIIGFSPYVTNILYKGHILYPAAGKGAKDYIQSNIPANLYDDSPPGRFFYSIFSKSDNIKGESSSAVLKMPFTYDPNELKAFRDTNAKEGGFGPFFSGAFLIAVAITLYLYLYIYLKQKVKFKYTIFKSTAVFFIILFSAMINPASSLARFVPQAWLLCILVLILAFSVKSYFTKFMGFIMIAVLALNNYLIAAEYISYNSAMTSQTESKLSSLAGEQEGHLIDLKEFSSTKIKLDKHNIRWTRIYSSQNCTARDRFLIHNVAEVCVY